MKNLIPCFIIENLKNKIYNGKFEAITMFIDISGFTTMTQILMMNGNEGAEILTEIINRIFTPSISTIYDNNGFISTFAGDAFTSIFPVNKSNIQAAFSSAGYIQNIFKEAGTQKTKFGEFKLKIKIGLSYGDIEWRIILTPQKYGYYFRGEAINNASFCEKSCQAGEVVIDEKLKSKSNIPIIKKSEQFFLVKSFPESSIEQIKLPITNISDLKSFIPDSILELKSEGEFRNVISCFISFEEKGEFYKKLADIIILAQEYGGYFNKINFGDKGGTLLILFGAPTYKEKMIIRACDFALSVMKIEELSSRIGISFGNAFAGFVGSDIRKEYTAIGMSVNLAARLMMNAHWGEIYLDKFVQQEAESIYGVSYLGDFKLKGFQRKIPVHKMSKKKMDVKLSLFKGKLFGRELELKKIKELLKPINKNKFGGIIYVDGPAGIGKSHFINELKRSLPSKKFHWLYFLCDGILRKSFNPVQYFLGDFFGQLEKNTTQINKENFERKIDEIVRNSNDKLLNAELLRSKPFLGALINLYWKNSLFEQLDGKNRYENILYSFKNLIKMIAIEKPTIIQIEDAHWVDEDTKTLLEVLVRNAQQDRFVILSVSRLREDDSEFKLEFKDIPEHRITLSPLQKDDVKTFIESKLNPFEKDKRKVPEETFDFIWKKSTGNPFYIEQIILYLKKGNLLDDKFNLINLKFEIPANINSLISARIDKLDPNLKEITKMASVLGKHFTVRVLSSMLKDKRIDQYIHDGEKENLWYSLSKLNYIFQNDFIPKSVYQLVLKRDLRHFHKLAAESIEDIYQKDLKRHYPDLAHNFKEAEIGNKAIFYLEKAGNYAKDMYQNKAALDYYGKLLQVLSTSKSSVDVKKITLSATLNKVELLLLLGNTEHAKVELIKLNPDSFADNELRDRYFYLIARYFITIENYYALKKHIIKVIKKVKTKFYKYYLEIYYLDALRFLNESEEFEKNAYSLLKFFKTKKERYFEGRLVNNIGIYCLQQARYKEAMKYFQTNYKIATEDNNKPQIRRALHNIGIVNSRLGDRQRAMKYYTQSLKVAKEIGDKNASCKLVSDIATILAIENKVEEALRYYQRGLELAKTIGNKMQEGLILYNIGEAYYRLKNYAQSLSYLFNSKNICEQIHDSIGITYANDLSGDIYYDLGKIQEAKKVYTENLKLQRKNKDMEGIAHTYGNLGNIARAETKFDDAEKFYKKQQEILSGIGDKEGEGKAYFNWAMLKIEKNEPKEALIKLEHALNFYEKCSYQEGLQNAQEQMKKLKKMLNYTVE